MGRSAGSMTALDWAEEVGMFMVRTESEAYGLRRQNASLLESALYTSLRPTPMSAPASVPAAPDSLLRSAKTGDPLRTVLDWLATPAAGDPGHEAAALATCLGVLAQARMDAAARVRVLDIFHDRALACATALKPQLAASGLPVHATLRDAADLAQRLATAGDASTRLVLQQYQASRERDVARSVGFTDFLVGAFSNDYLLTRVPRGIGLAVVDMLPGARRALARRMLFGAAK